MFRLNPIKLFVLIIFLTIPFRGYSAGKQVLKHDTVSLHSIEVPKATLDNLKETKSFKYRRASVTPGFFQRLFMMLSQWEGFRFLSRMAPWTIYTILFLAFVILIIVLFKNRFQGVFIRNQDEPGLHASRNEIADNINFEQLIDEALKQGNYNLAVRYLYLSLLRRLSQKNMIEYKIEKTNFEYISEISSADIRPLFRNVTHDYEYAWYGQFPLDERSYRQIEGQYKSLTDKLNG